MAWTILRTTADALDDPDYINTGASPDVADCISVGELRRSPEGRFAVRAAWVDAGGAIINGAGVASLQLVTVDQLPDGGGGAIATTSVGPSASLSSPPILGAREPMTFEAMSMSGLITIRCSDMTAPGLATRLRIFVETMD